MLSSLALRRRAARRAAATVALVVLAGCAPASDGDDGASPGAPRAATPRAAATDLACDTQGYACAWSDMSDQEVGDVLAVAEEARQRLPDAGLEEVGAWLVDAHDAEVVHGDGALRFRIGDGRPVWIGDERTFEASAAVAAASAEGLARAAALADPVGEDPEDKHALVMSVYEWELGGAGTTDAIARTLESTRGYQDNVTVRRNDDELDTDADGAGIEAFGDWAQYDVVHVLTHGAQVCEQDGACTTMLAAGRLGDDEAAAEGAGEDRLTRDVRGQDEPGVSIALNEDGYHWALESDWFSSTYRGGLPDTLVWVNGCQTMKGDDLARALTSGGGVFVGWSEKSLATESQAAALEFYRYMSETGHATREGFAHLADEDLDAVTFEHEGETIAARLEPAVGAELRIRETVELQRSGSGARLTVDDVLAVAREDDTDELPLWVQVDGVLPEDVGAFEVVVEMDGREILAATLDGRGSDVPVEQLDEESYRLKTVVELPARIEELDSRIDLRAVVEPLPEEGRTEHVVRVALAGCRSEVSWSGPAFELLDDLDGTYEEYHSVGSDTQVYEGDDSLAAPVRVLDVDMDPELPNLTVDTGTNAFSPPVVAEPAYRWSLEIDADKGHVGTADGTIEFHTEHPSDGGSEAAAFTVPVTVDVTANEAREGPFGLRLHLLVAEFSGAGQVTGPEAQAPQFPTDESPLSGAEPLPPPEGPTGHAEISGSLEYTFSGCG